MSIVILVVSAALFCFYIQAICERALRREFSHPYFREIASAIQLEFPHLSEGLAKNASVGYSEMRLALQCDFVALSYLLKRGGPTRRHLSKSEKLLIHYFRFQLFCMPIRHALKLQEKETALKLTTMLQYFANLTGERLSASSLDNALPSLQP
jgi:hypothetical protein